MAALTIEASPVKKGDLQPCHQGATMYELDCTLEHSSSPDARNCHENLQSGEEGVGIVQDLLQNMGSLVDKAYDTNEGTRDQQHAFQNTFFGIKNESISRRGSPENTIQEYKQSLDNIHDNIIRSAILNGSVESETFEAVESITSQAEILEKDEMYSCGEVKPVVIGNIQVPSLDLSSASGVYVQDVVLDLKQNTLLELPGLNDSPQIDTKEASFDSSWEERESEVNLNDSGVHVYHDLKPVNLETQCPPREVVPSCFSSLERNFPIDSKIKETDIERGILRSGFDMKTSVEKELPVNKNIEIFSDRSNSSSFSEPKLSNIGDSAVSRIYENQMEDNPIQSPNFLENVHSQSGNGLQPGTNNGMSMLLQEFQDITNYNRRSPETIMLGPAEMALEPSTSSPGVEERVSMHNKSLKLKKFKKKLIEMNLTCEWMECEVVSTDLNDFIQHTTDHIHEQLEDYAEEPEFMTCHWRHCGYETQRGIRDMLRHIYFHAFHVKLKCLGIQMIIDNNLHACRTDGSSRNLIPELPESLICGWEHCGHVCENAEYFYRHVDLHANNAPMDNPKCYWEGCTVKVRNRTRLRDHLRSHTQEKVIACPTCGGLFSNRCKFSDHLRRQGPMETLCYQCSHCNKKYTTERLLRDHMRVHVNHYKCPFCDMTCPNPSTLNAHIKYRHSDEKPYECEYCQHQAKSSNDLRKHMEVHNDKKIFNCEYPGCDYSHKTFHGVSYHYRLNHQTPKKYQCHMCQEAFARGSFLTKHLQRVHRFKWPSGHSRFKYRQQDDGTLRLQMVRYESVDLASHFLEKDGDNQHPGPREGHSMSYNPVPAYQSDTTENPAGPTQSSNADTNKSCGFLMDFNSAIQGCPTGVASRAPDQFLNGVNNSPYPNGRTGSLNHNAGTNTSLCSNANASADGRGKFLSGTQGKPLSEADLSYNLEMLGDVALHEPEYCRSLENSPVKAVNHVESSPVKSSKRKKSAKFDDLPSPIHGSAFRANVAVHEDASERFIALSSNLPTSPEKRYEGQAAMQNNKTPEKTGSSRENRPNNEKIPTNTTPWKVSFHNSPHKRRRQSTGTGRPAKRSKKQPTPGLTNSGQDKTEKTLNSRQKRQKRYS